MNTAIRAINTAVYQRRDYVPLPEATQANRPQTSYTRVTGLRSPWNQALKNRLNDLSQLELGWDGYRGRPVLFSAANFAAMMLEHLYVDGLISPSLVPRSDGCIQVEWHKNQFDIELVVAGTQEVTAHRYDQLTGEEQELELDNDFTEVAMWLGLLLQPRRELAAVEA